MHLYCCMAMFISWWWVWLTSADACVASSHFLKPRAAGQAAASAFHLSENQVALPWCKVFLLYSWMTLLGSVVGARQERVRDECLSQCCGEWSNLNSEPSPHGTGTKGHTCFPLLPGPCCGATETSPRVWSCPVVGMCGHLTVVQGILWMVGALAAWRSVNCKKTRLLSNYTYTVSSRALLA